MPTVDFTLQDIIALIDEKLDARLGPNLEKIDARLDARLDAKLSEHFISFIENNFTPALKGIRRIVRKHSADIAELQAGKGL